MDNEILQKLQATLTEIAEFTDGFFNENNLRYSVAYGSAIGMIRHQGFIPWDDDFDIMTPYEDYIVLVEVWDKSIPQGYYLQKIDKNSHINHAKIRKEHTEYIGENDVKNTHDGIFLDIFPMYKIPKKKLSRIRFLFWSIARLVFTRDYSTKNDGTFLKIITKILVGLPKKIKMYLLNKSNRVIEKYQKISDFDYVDIASFPTLFIYYDKSLFDKIESRKFDKTELKIFCDYDSVLKKEYKDYMTLPPVKDRVCTHNPIKITFEDDYGN